MEKLLKQFQQVRIGSTEHGEWQRWAMAEGRCLKCIRKGHISRTCPGIPNVRRIEAYTEEEEYPDGYEYEEEYDCDAVVEEQDPHGA
jgi:hypothetical protein